jgi:hypothetical protein
VPPSIFLFHQVVGFFLNGLPQAQFSHSGSYPFLTILPLFIYLFIWCSGLNPGPQQTLSYILSPCLTPKVFWENSPNTPPPKPTSTPMLYPTARSIFPSTNYVLRNQCNYSPSASNILGTVRTKQTFIVFTTFCSNWTVTCLSFPLGCKFS